MQRNRYIATISHEGSPSGPALSAFSLTIPVVTGSLNLSATGAASSLTAVMRGPGDPGNPGDIASTGDGGAGGDCVSGLTIDSLASGDLIGLSVSSPGTSTACYLYQGAYGTTLIATASSGGNSNPGAGVLHAGGAGGAGGVGGGGGGGSAGRPTADGSAGFAGGVTAGGSGAINPGGDGSGGNGGAIGNNPGLAASSVGGGGGGGGKDVTDHTPAGGAGGVGRIVINGMTAGTGLAVNSGNEGLIVAIADNGSGKCRVTTINSDLSNLIAQSPPITGTSVSAYNTTHNVTAVNGSTFDTDVNYVSALNGVSGLNITAVGYWTKT